MKKYEQCEILFVHFQSHDIMALSALSGDFAETAPNSEWEKILGLSE